MSNSVMRIGRGRGDVQRPAASLFHQVPQVQYQPGFQIGNQLFNIHYIHSLYYIISNLLNFISFHLIILISFH